MTTHKPTYIAWCLQKYLYFLAAFNEKETWELDTIDLRLLPHEPGELSDSLLGRWDYTQEDAKRWVRHGHEFHSGGWNIVIIEDTDVDGTPMDIDFLASIERDNIKKDSRKKLILTIRLQEILQPHNEDMGVGTETVILLYHTSK